MMFSPHVISEDKVKVELFWKHQFEFAGFYAAIAKGYYREHNIHVTFVEYNPQDEYIENVLAGKSHFATSGNSLLKEFHNGKQLKLLASYFKRSSVAIAAQEKITSLKQLEGETIYSPQKFLLRGGIRNMLNLHDVDTSNINTRSDGNPFQLFTDNKIAAMAIFLTDQPYELRRQNISYRIFNPNQYGMVTHDMNLFTSEKFASENAELTSNFTAATNKGWQYALKHPVEIVELIRSKYNTQGKSKEALLFEAEETIKLMVPKLYSIGAIDENKLMLASQNLLKNKQINSIRNLEQFLIGKHNVKNDQLILNSEELDFISSSNQIRLCRLKYSEGAYTSVRIANIITRDTGLKISLSDPYSWAEALEALRTKRCDILSNATNTEKRRETMRFTPPYFTSQKFLLTKAEQETVTDLSKHMNETFAIAKGDVTANRIKQVYPHIIFNEVEIPVDGAKLVQKGLAFAFIASDYIIKKMVSFNELDDLKINTNLSSQFDDPHTIATRKEDKVLSSILTKAVLTSNKQEISKLLSQ